MTESERMELIESIVDDLIFLTHHQDECVFTEDTQ